MQNQGIFFEQKISCFYHKSPSHIPLLVSPLFLRERGLGQIDVGSISKKGILVAECKSNTERISYRQELRLKNTLKLLVSVFELPAQLFLISGFAKSENSAYPFKVKKIGELA